MPESPELTRFHASLRAATSPDEARAVFHAATHIPERQRWYSAAQELKQLDTQWLWALLDEGVAWRLSIPAVQYDPTFGPDVVAWIERQYDHPDAIRANNVVPWLHHYILQDDEDDEGLRQSWWPDLARAVPFLTKRLALTHFFTNEAHQILEVLKHVPNLSEDELLHAYQAVRLDDQRKVGPEIITAFASHRACGGALAAVIWVAEDERLERERERNSWYTQSDPGTWRTETQQAIITNAAVWGSPTLSTLVSTPAFFDLFVRYVFQGEIYHAGLAVAALRGLGRVDPASAAALFGRLTEKHERSLLNAGLEEGDLVPILAHGGSEARHRAMNLLGRMTHHRRQDTASSRRLRNPSSPRRI